MAPFEMMPSVLQKIGIITPQYWAHDGLEQAMTGTLTTQDFLLTIGMLLGYGSIGLIGTLIMYPTFLRRAKS